ncbi:MAG: hypothetical protein N2C14_03515 [Planctomycetales bacterium]
MLRCEACVLAACLSLFTAALGGEQGARCKSFLGEMPPELAYESSDWCDGSDPATWMQLQGKVVWLQFNF